VVGFFALVHDRAHPHRVAVGRVRPQLFRLALGRRRDHAQRGLHDVGGGTVVLLELDDDRARKVFLEAADEPHVRAAPAVNRLVVVTDHAQVLRLL
jgi:hypothetical protein